MSRLLVQLSNLFKSFHSLNIFDDFSLSLHEGDSFALIGENGAGKTTLLKLLAGQATADEGLIQQTPHLRIGFLPQEVVLTDSESTVRHYIEEGPLTSLEREMAACLNDPDRLDAWAELHEKYEKLGGYRQTPIEKALSGLKLEPLLDLPMRDLSSGQRVRVALAKALMEDPDLLLLDEPTNHLDQEMVVWLQEVLKKRAGATVIVSHDRQFLNTTCNRLIEIQGGRLSYYGGSYDYYLEEQKHLLARQMRAYEEEQKERAQLKQKIKAMTFSKTKAPPPSDRHLMAYDQRGERHQKSLQRNLDTLKARLEEIETNPLPHPKPKSVTGLKFAPCPLASHVALELEEIGKSFGEKTLFTNISKTLYKGSRTILTGPNGSGKTTLLRCLAGALPIDSGNLRYAPTAKIAYLDQEVDRLPIEQTPLEYFALEFNLSEESLRKELHKAALGGAELLNRTFSTLSVGQRKRLMLLVLILEKPNVLLLDEPTNHLDFLTLEAFEKALLDFEGAILAVSHDSTFITKIATDIWKLQEDGKRLR